MLLKANFACLVLFFFVSDFLLLLVPSSNDSLILVRLSVPHPYPHTVKMTLPVFIYMVDPNIFVSGYTKTILLP